MSVLWKNKFLYNFTHKKTEVQIACVKVPASNAAAEILKPIRVWF